jgi:four helix bundle protein
MDSRELKDRTKRFAVRIVKLFQSLPSRPDAQILGKQVLRSGTSVAANYRAACRGRSRAEFVARIGVVVEEADETLFWLDLIGEAGIVPEQRLVEIKKEADELTALFTATKRTIRLNK